MLLCSVYYFVWIRSYVYYLCISMARRSICSWRRFWHDFDTMTKSIEVQILVRSFWTSISYLVRTWTTYSSSIVLKSEKKVQFKEAAHRCLHYFPIHVQGSKFRGVPKFWVLTWIEQKRYHFLAVTENLWFLELVLESMTTPIRIPKIK